MAKHIRHVDSMTMPAGENRALDVDEAWKNLAYAVVLQAANDYRSIAAGRNIQDQSLYALERFFKSGWCQMLCGHLDPTTILEKLKKEAAHE